MMMDRDSQAQAATALDCMLVEVFTSFNISSYHMDNKR